MQINGKHIIVTGASSGIGLELVKGLLKYENVKIIAVARNIETIPTLDGVVFPFSSDLSNKEGVDSLFNYAQSVWKRTDIFIANAGYAYMEKLEEPNWQHIENIYNLNVFSPIYSLEKLSNSNGSHSKFFVCLSSAVSSVPLPYYSLYCSTKAAIHQFMETYRYEKAANISTMTVYPVATRTTFFTKASSIEQPPLPFITQSPKSVAQSIIKGIINNKRKVSPSLLFRVFNRIGNILPVLFSLYSSNEKRKTQSFLNN